MAIRVEAEWRIGSRPRDQQRAKLYRAEREVFDLFGPLIGDGSVAAAQAYIDKVCARAPIRRRYPHVARGVWVKDGRRRRSASGGTGYVKLPRWARQEWVALHELAHSLQGLDGAWHGPRFARIYLDLVRFAMGKEAHDALRASFRRHRVKVAPAKPKRGG